MNGLSDKDISILIIDKDTRAIDDLKKNYSDSNISVFSCSSSEYAIDILKGNPIDVIIASLEDTDETCIEVVKDYRTANPQCIFYLLVNSEYDLVDISSEHVKTLVEDYLYKPLNPARLKAKIELALGRMRSESRSLQLIDPVVRQAKPFFIFRSRAMQKALMNLPEIAQSEHTVLITGETGTGKEIVARAIHSLSRRANGPFVPLNCGAIPETLIEGELFGHEKGAFTGAITTRKGKFENAQGGTLFLDEIGDMALNLQARLLRVLEDKRIYRLGGSDSIHVDVRVIAATNTDLLNAVNKGLFREDLLYRLNVFRINLPPLRERQEDIALLARHFFERALSELGRTLPYPVFSPETIFMLEGLRWRGNVRELRNVMTRAATFLPVDTERVFPFHIIQHLEETCPIETKQISGSSDYSGYYMIPKEAGLEEAEDMIIEEALKTVGRNKTRAARLLGISVRTLRRRLNKKEM